MKIRFSFRLLDFLERKLAQATIHKRLQKMFYSAYRLFLGLVIIIVSLFSAVALFSHNKLLMICVTCIGNFDPKQAPDDGINDASAICFISVAVLLLLLLLGQSFKTYWFATTRIVHVAQIARSPPGTPKELMWSKGTSRFVEHAVSLLLLFRSSVILRGN